MTGVTKRDEEIRVIWTENQWLYLVVGFLGGVLLCLLMQLSILNLPELVQNLIPELTGIFITITVIDQMNRRRDERNAVKQLQEQLVRDASSMVNDVAVNAVHQLEKHGWLEGDKGLLTGADLERANLQGANLVGANLLGTGLRWAKLQGANLIGANLQRADLYYANLQAANLGITQLQAVNLQGANLKEVNLELTNLTGANLRWANLGEARLFRTNLQAANLENARLQEARLIAPTFDETTILPDGTHWTPETDMTKFTQPEQEAGAE